MSAPLPLVPPRCTVRGCGLGLASSERRLVCPAGHAFDRARGGYVSLLQPDHRRSRQPGDAAEVVAARGRLLARGWAAALVAVLGGWIDDLRLAPGAAVLDLGCGGGEMLAALCAPRQLAPHGIDLSVRAAARAARLLPGGLVLVANADRELPFADQAFDLLLSIDGRRNPPEMRRVLKPGGRLLVAVPAAGDLAELRALVQGRAEARDRRPALETALGAGFVLERQAVARGRLRLDRAAIADVLLATYRGGRHSQQARVAGIDRIEATVAHDLSQWRPA